MFSRLYEQLEKRFPGRVIYQVPIWLRSSILRLILTTAGFGFAFSCDTQRFMSPAFNGLKLIMPIHAWGLLFFLCAATCAVAVVLKNTRWVERALIATGTLHLFISLGYLFEALRDGRASFIGAAAFLSIAASVFANANFLSRTGAK